MLAVGVGVIFCSQFLVGDALCTFTSPDHDLLSHFSVHSISTRLAQRDLTFIHSVFSGRIKSTDIVEMFGLCVPARRTRGKAILNEPTARVETVRAGMFCRLPRHVNFLY